jgi:energy-coupling factor transporter ATP-binding protein EcfA2
MKQVTVRDIGPVSELTFPVPPDGGVVVLKGRNGLGKTRTLEAINTLTTGRGNVQQRDGAPNGQVDGFGATLKVARRQTRAGELEVTSLEGRFSVLDLVDPKLKAQDAADAKRIKALVQLQGATADPSLFYKLAGGREVFDQYVTPHTLDTDDLVTMAARIKADFEKQARAIEAEAEKTNIKAAAAREQTAGIDLDAPDDQLKLQEDLKLAIAEEARLKQLARSALDAQYNAEEAARQLHTAEANYSGPGVAVAQAQVETARDEAARAQHEVNELERQLITARRTLEIKQVAVRACEQTLQAAEHHEETIGRWRATIGASRIDSPTDEQLNEARTDVEAAQAAVELGARVRDAKRQMNQSSIYAGEAARLRTQADRLRMAAQGTDEVLSEVVQSLGCPLKVKGGRLVTPTERSPEELFSDLSRGEQWKLALDIAIDAVGKHGVIVVDQEGWEGIDPENRKLIAEHLKGTGVVMITAECDEGELRAETIAA